MDLFTTSKPILCIAVCQMLCQFLQVCWRPKPKTLKQELNWAEWPSHILKYFSNFVKDRLSAWMCLLTPSLRHRARGKERALQESFAWLCSCREQLSCWETPGERKDTLNDSVVIVKEMRVWGRMAKLNVPSDMWSWQNNTLMSRSMWRERERDNEGVTERGKNVSGGCWEE